MAMSRKHYKEFAAVIKDNLDNYPEDIDADIRSAISAIAYDMCRVFKMDNPAFSRDRFIEAATGQKVT